MTQLSNVCNASHVNNQILFFDRHDSHLNDGALRQMMCKDIQPFVLKSCDFIHDEPDDNGQNSKLEPLYNVANSVCILNYGTTKFSPHQMTSALV